MQRDGFDVCKKRKVFNFRPKLFFFKFCRISNSIYQNQQKVTTFKGKCIHFRTHDTVIRMQETAQNKRHEIQLYCECVVAGESEIKSGGTMKIESTCK